jgi:CRISPR/Cas system CSM-associated protein Csm3 (group 7 of RAMP superfamily)
MNPYDFVRLPERVVRERPLTHHKFQNHNGTMLCRLTAISPIFIPAALSSGSAQRFIHARYNGSDLPVIPGSSLKGVVRSVAEAISPSCVGLSRELFDRHGTLESRYRRKIRSEFETCKNAEKLCPACRIFGMVSGDSHFLGKISISDAHTKTGQFKTGAEIILKPLMEPKPRHTAFYLPDDEVAGRKFYFHQAAPNTTIQPTPFTKKVIPLEGLNAQGEAQTIFDFDVTFSNLTDDEYSILVFSLTLTEGMRHKVGSGKPHGLGTVRIEILELSQTDANRRYRGLAAKDQWNKVEKNFSGDSLKDHVQSVTSPIFARPSRSLADLQRIWQYPPARDSKGKLVEYKFPDQEWFAENSATPISETP